MSSIHTYKLTELFDLIGGGTPKTTVKEYWDGDIPWISVVDFNGDRKFLFETEKHITPRGLSESSTKLLDKGDIIISARGTVGELGVLTLPMAFNQSCYGIKAKPVTTNSFLYYLLQVKIAELKNHSHGSVFSTITRSTFENITAELPDKKSQHRIAEILSSLDDKIELNRQMNQTMEQMAQALLNHHFVDGIDPANLSKGWKRGILGDLIKVLPGYAFKGSSFKEYGDWKVIKIKNINNGVVNINDTLYVKKETYYNLDKKFKVKGGDILFAMTGAEVGKVGIVPITDDILVLNQRVCKIENNIPFGRDIGYFILSSDLMYEKIQGTAQGSAQPNISANEIESIKINISSDEIYNNIGPIFKGFIDQIAQNLSEINTLIEVRDYLLPKLISGEIIPSDIQQLERSL